jgi:type IV fimbrial biogenesis protein FimT
MKKNFGFTLIELMITLAIIAILLTVGVPSLKTFLQGNQLIASTNDLISALHVARSEAIKLGSKVSICTSSNGTSCSGSANWEDGWIVFVDADGNRVGTGASCTGVGLDCLLRVHDGVNANDLTMLGVDQNSNAIQSFTFTSRGLPKDINNIAQSGAFNICSLSGSTTIDSRAVILSLSGRARVSDNSAVITQCP